METLPTLAWRPLERLINHGIRQSSTAGALAAALDGKSLRVRVEGMPWQMQLAAGGGQVRVSGGETPGELPTATVEGGPLSILGLLRGDPQARIRDGQLRISGDTEVATQFHELLRMAAPDLEEELSKVLGDPLAHQVGSLAQALAHWGERAARSVSRSLGEYLTEERQLLPTRTEATEFYAAVDTLAGDVDRAEARLTHLRRTAEQNR